MGTHAEETEAPVGYIERASGVVSEIRERSVQTAYGSRQTAGMYPLVLILIAAVCQVLDGWLATAIGVMAIGMLALWVGGKR